MIAPRPVTNANSTATDLAPFIAADGVTLYFASGRDDPQNDDIFVATAGAAFADVMRVPDLSSSASDGAVEISADGLTATVTSGREGLSVGGQNLWQATRLSPSEPFSGFTAEPFANVNTPGDEYEHWTSPDGLRIYVSALVDGMQHISLSSRATATSVFSTPVPIAELDSPATQCCHSLTSDERVIVFGSRRAGPLQHYYATRPNRTEPFSPPRIVPSVLAPSGFDLHTSLTQDGCTLFLSSTRPGLGAFDLWVSEI